MTEQPTDPWLIAESDDDGNTVIFRLRENIPAGVTPSDYPHLIRIVWAYDGGESGMPADEVNDEMFDLEDRLDLIEGGAVGYLMVAMTGNHQREWIWYVRDTENFVSRVNQVVREGGPYPIELEAASDPEWKNYSSFISSLESQ